VSGSNGVGKSNFYKALAMLKALADGSFAEFVADEGGMNSLMWAGPAGKKEPKRVACCVRHELFEYELEVGLVSQVPMDSTLFKTDPDIKQERLYVHYEGGRSLVATRKGPQVRLLDKDHNFEYYEFGLMDTESVLSQVREPDRFPFVALVRDELLKWRFFHEFDTGRSSMLRVPQVAFRSPFLAESGLNWISVLQTVKESGFDVEMEEVFSAAFPDRRMRILAEGNRLNLEIEDPTLQRGLALRELSDGTLRYLCLIAALMSAESPSLIVLNEPEMSLHESLYQPLAELIRTAANRTQLVVVTHASGLSDILEDQGKPIELAMEEGQTKLKEDLGVGRVWKFD